MGVAVLDGEELLYYGVKTTRARETVEAVCKNANVIVRSLIEDYRPQALALNRPLVIQPGGERLVSVIRELKRSAEEAGIPVYEYAPKTVRQFICGSKKATRQEAARVISARYPALKQYAEDRGMWEELYYARMFAAVAVGLTDYYSRIKDSPTHLE